MVDQHRRRFVAALGAAGLSSGLAGCAVTDDSGPGNETDGSDGNETDGTSGNETDGDGDGGDGGPNRDHDREVVDDFEDDFDLWRDLDTYGEFGAETEDPYDGSRSLRFVADEDEPYVGVTRAFSDPIDMSGKTLSVALKVNEPEVYRIEIRLLAPGQGNMVHLNRTHAGPTGTWLRVDLGATSETGSPDIGEVYEIQVVGRAARGEDPVDFVVDAIHLDDAPDQGMVMLTWTGDHESQFRAAEMMREYDFPGVAGVVHQTVGGGNRLDIPQLREMQQAGWDVVSFPHPPNGSGPLSQFDENRQRQIIEDSRQWLRQRGFEEGANHYIAPGDHRDATNLELLREIHESSMSFGGANIGVPLSDPHTIGWFSGGNLGTVGDYVDLAEKYNQLSAPMWSILGEEYDNHEITEDEYESLLEYVDERDVRVVTPSDLVGGDS